MHRECWQPLTARRETDVALVLTKLYEVLLVDDATQLGHQVLRIFGAAVEREQPVEIGKHGSAQATSVIAIERDQARQALRRQNQVRTVLAQLGQDRLVVRAWNGVKLVDEHG